MPAKDGDVLVATRVSLTERDRLDARARERGVSRSELIRWAIEDELL